MNSVRRWRATFLGLARTYDFLIFYALSIALGRGLSIFVLPLTSRFIEPQDYARLDVAASIIEITGLVASFALSDLIFRFAARAATPEDQNRIASEILGVGLICALATLLVAEVLMPVFAATLPVGVGEWSLRAGLAGAACGGLVELPLAWLRLRDRPRAYLGFIALRSMTQIGLMIAVLALGYGPEGVLVSNACIEFVLVAALVFLQIREFGLSFSRAMLRNALHYSTPIVLGSFAMFGLGSCDRFFLAGAVPAAELARYTLAGKLAFAAPLMLQPFALWWNPRRIAVLSEAGGIERSRRMVGYGFFVLFVSCSLTILCGSLFIKLALPPSYHDAVRYLPFLVLITGLNEFATLVNVGSFARSHGRELLYVNGAGGIVAVLGYCLLVPLIGIAGAIAATVLGHALRVALFILFGRKQAPIAYPVLGIGVMTLSLAALLAVKPAEGGPLIEFCFVPLSLLVLWLEAQLFEMVPRLRLPWPGYRPVRNTQA